MNTEQYKEFKQWLIDTDNLSLLPDAISYLFSYNRRNGDLFKKIQEKQYSSIYWSRHDYHYKKIIKKNPNYGLLFSLAFEYLGESYPTYLEYEATKDLSQFANSNILFVHQGNISCLRYNHPIEDIAASIAVDAPSPIKIHASFCRKCNVAFIHKSLYLSLRRQYHFLVANFCELSEDGYSPRETSSRAAESPLMLCGYNVKQNGLSKDQRQSLLQDILYNGILTKTQIIEYLEYFIQFNGQKENMHFAVAKWESDLAFVRNFDISTHPVVSISEIRHYTNVKKP